MAKVGRAGELTPGPSVVASSRPMSVSQSHEETPHPQGPLKRNEKARGGTIPAKEHGLRKRGNRGREGAAKVNTQATETLEKKRRTHRD